MIHAHDMRICMAIRAIYPHNNIIRDCGGARYPPDRERVGSGDETIMLLCLHAELAAN